MGPHGISALHRSSVASLALGLVVLLWGAAGLAQAGLFAMEQVWNVPGPARPGYVPRLGRAAAFLGVLAVGLAISTLLGGLVTYGHHDLPFRMLSQALAVLANVGLYLASFRVLTPKGIPSRNLVPGAVAGGIVWTALQAAGRLRRQPRPAHRLGLRDLRHRAGPARLDLPGGPGRPFTPLR